VVSVPLEDDGWSAGGKRPAGGAVPIRPRARPNPSRSTRELNELNFARFDAKLEQRVVELRAEMQAGFARAEAELDRRIGVLRAEMQAGFETGDAKLDQRLATTAGLVFGVVKLLGG